MFLPVEYLPIACTLGIIVYQNCVSSNTRDRVKKGILYPMHGKKNMEDLGRLTRDAPPTDYILKVESFSTLSSSSLERYESPEFEAAGTKWKLAIYSNGNKPRGGQNHISLYLVLADKSCLTLNKEILVTFRLFVFDNISEKYLTVERVGRFNKVTSESGFDKFLPLRVFKDAINGYLINDTCMFGAEVFLIQPTDKLKCLSMVEVKSNPFRYTWKVQEFSKLEDKEYFSEKFTAWGYDWKLRLDPKGNKNGKGNFLSLYLRLVDSETDNLRAEKQVIAELELRLVDQLNKNHIAFTGTASFGTNRTWGWPQFFESTQLMDKSNGYLVKDSLTLEADIVVLGSATKWV